MLLFLPNLENNDVYVVRPDANVEESKESGPVELAPVEPAQGKHRVGAGTLFATERSTQII